MLKLDKIGNNQTQITLPNGNIVLFSYNTPVAYYEYATCKYFKTDKKWSVTTSKHINKWLTGFTATEVDQDLLDNAFIRSF